MSMHIDHPVVTTGIGLEGLAAPAMDRRLLRVVNGDRPLLLERCDRSVQRSLPPGWRGVVWMGDGVQLSGQPVRLTALAHGALVKLQFFLDQAAAGERMTAPTATVAVLSDNSTLASGPESLGQWYLGHALRADEDYLHFAQALRSCESYSLLGFLNDSVASSDTLQMLAEQYGVSVSHFRRLGRCALGGTVKTGLRQWRTARALLAMTDGRRPLTDVAMQLGYASSSHFSKEIKELVGVVPSRLIDITRLPNNRVNP
jgi:AraC-like DNA-binding protein